MTPSRAVIASLMLTACGQPPGGDAEASSATEGETKSGTRGSGSTGGTGGSAGSQTSADDETSGSGGESSGTGDTTGVEPVEPSTHFEGAADWSVPAGGWAGDGFVRPSAFASDLGDDDWSTFDITGDGTPDLVVTANFDGKLFEVFGNGGAPHWNVYEGGANGFAGRPTQWSVPDGGWAGDGFVRPSAFASDAGDDDWSTFDITGDGIPDLVVTANFDGDLFEVFGNGSRPHWNVYEGGASGFADSPTQWNVPDGGWAGDGFVRPSAFASDAGDDDWSTFDITGDGTPDLVVTANFDGELFGVFGNGGDPHWNVYEGSAGGFADSPSEWSVPAGGWAGDGFIRASAFASDAGDDDWSTFDLNGDGQPDLVVTANFDGDLFEVFGNTDAPHWNVYVGTDGGFAGNPLEWSIPSGGWAGDGFVRPSAFASDAGDDEWSTFDLNGDGRPDLVVTANFDGDVFEVFGNTDAPHWRAYFGAP